MLLLTGPLAGQEVPLPAQAFSPPSSAPETRPLPAPAEPAYAPPLWSTLPFVALLLTIAVLPLLPSCRRFWEHNEGKLLVALALSAPALLFYWLGHPGLPRTGAAAPGVPPGWPMVEHALSAAILEAYVPFIVLLFALYVISGGIQLEGDLRARPGTNTAFLAVGSVLASFIGTTGAAMVLINPLLATNAERKHVRHTVIFFIFLVCNIGGCLLPLGDPPLFLGYLQGVPFLWTLGLAPEWAICTTVLLALYYVADTLAYRKEAPPDIRRDETAVRPLRLAGKINLVYLVGVVLSAGLLVPGQPFVLAPELIVPEHLRELVMVLLAVLSLATTPAPVRKANEFSFAPIAEVAALFLGIFITMQAPLEILRVRGGQLGLTQPWQFFWATGGLSGFLDNAPTYLVFLQTAGSLTPAGGAGVLPLAGGQFVRADLLVAVSLGAVFMGANTYIGNGPNFMVRAIAERRGVKMPGFFGYMLYSVGILVPLFALLTLVFFVWKVV